MPEKSVQIHHHHLSQSVFLFMFVQRHHYQIQIEIHHHQSQSVNLFMCAPASILARVVSAQALEEKSFEVVSGNIERKKYRKGMFLRLR